jgi:hypothetical protein
VSAALPRAKKNLQRITLGRYVATPECAVFAAWFLMVSPWLFGSRTIPYDALDQFYPSVVFTATSLLAGESALWNPWVFAGFPHVADPQGMSFSPTMIGLMLFNPSLHWFNTVVLLHLLIGGIGIARIGRAAGWSTAATVLAASVFMFGGQASGRLQHVVMTVSWAFLPWVIHFVGQVAKHGGRRNALRLGLAGGLTGLQLTQLTYLGALLALGYCTFLVISRTRAEGTRGLPRLIGLFTVSAIMALLIASPQIVSTLSVLEFTARHTFDYATASALSMHWHEFVTFLAPNALGSTDGTYVGKSDVTETYSYVGVVAAALIAAAWTVRRPAAWPAERWFWIGVVAVGLLFAVGKHGFLHQLMFHAIPGANLFRRPADGMFVAILGLSLLAGDACNTFVRTAEVRRFAVRAAIACCVVIAFAMLCAHLFSTAINWRSVVVSGMVAIVLLFAARNMRFAQPAMVLVAVLGVVDLRVNNVHHHNAQSLKGRSHMENIEANPGWQVLRSELARFPAHAYRAEWLGYPNQNGAMLARVPISGGYNPLTLRDYAELSGTQSFYLAPRRPFGGDAAYADVTARLLGTRYVAVSAASLAEHGGLFSGMRRVEEVEVHNFSRVIIFENALALPRLITPKAALPHPAHADLPPALRSNDLTTLAFIDTPSRELARCRGAVSSARILKYTNDRVDIETHADQPAWIVLNDAYMPWWRAKASGVDLPIRRANGAFRAVCVPAGVHEVVMQFAPIQGMIEQWRAKFTGAPSQSSN